MGWKPVELANQNFGEGDDFLKSVANQARKAYCAYVALDNSIPDIPIDKGGLISGMQNEFVRSMCELPEDPVPLPPPVRSPSNQGKCECVAYQIKGYYQTTNNEPISFSNEVYGPVTPYTKTVDTPPNERTQVGYTHRGIYGGGCLPDLQDNIVRQDGVQFGLKMVITSIKPYAPNPPAPVDCQRPTLPTDKPVSNPKGNPPVINIPISPTINIPVPVIPVPIPIPVGGGIAPHITFDVGGINITFAIGDVDITFNPKLDVPFTFNPPGYQQPSLPPAIDPFTYAGILDCCDEIKRRVDFVGSQVTKVDLEVQEVRDDVKNVKTVQNGSVVPLLKDIQECTCLPDAVLFQSFTNVQDAIFPAGDEEVAFATVRLISGTPKEKVFGTPGGEEVTIIGWYAFGRSGRWGERKPLQYKENIMIPPSRGWNTFTFSVYNSLKANCQIFTYKKETT